MLRSFMKFIDSVQRLGKMKDSITTGLLGGLIGAISMSLSNLMMYKARKTEVKSFGQLAGQLILAPLRTKQRKNFVLGEFLHLVIGSLSGIPLFYVLKRTGKDHYLTKGLAASTLLWGTLFNGGQKVGLFKKLRFTKTHYSSVWSHIIYGLVASQAIVSLADPTIFASANNIEEPSRKDKTDTADLDFRDSSNEIMQFQPHRIVH